MLRVALTGGIATGKSYVLDLFRRRGISCLDADALARGVTTAGTEATHAIAARFGPAVIAADGSVDRQRLGSIVFADDAARRELETIVHPPVYRAIAAGLRAFDLMGESIAVVDVPLLYETGHEGDFDRVVVTVAPMDAQVGRLAARGIGESDARLRIAAQMPAADKAARADFVIRTDGTFENTERQVEDILRKLKGRS